jgi:hypothetical protein
MVNRIWKIVLVGVVIALLAAEGARADEKTADRAALDRKARAALALAATARAPHVATAPEPRPVARDYGTAHAAAIVEQRPLVVFVACEVQRCEGAICSKVEVDTFGHVKGPAVVVGYPQGRSLVIDSTLDCPADPKDLERAVDRATRKIVSPPAKPMPEAPPPADWKISADVPTSTATEGDGLEELNAWRAARGYRPFLRDDGLTAGAQGSCSATRATTSRSCRPAPTARGRAARPTRRPTAG